MTRYYKRSRPSKDEPAKSYVKVRFSDVEYARFLSMYEESGVYGKSIFIHARVFTQLERGV